MGQGNKPREKKPANKPLTLPGSELWKAIANMEGNMQALDDTRTISDQARGRNYQNHFQADMSATAASPALGPLKLPVELLGEGVNTLRGKPSVNQPQANWNEERDLGVYLGADQIKENIANASTLREDVKWRNIFNAVYGAEATDSIYEDIGGDENNIIPDDNKYGPDVRGQQKLDAETEVTDNNEIVNAVQKDNQLKEKIPIGTPAAKAFADGTAQQQSEWEDLRWQAQKRHKKLFDYNTKEE